MMPVTAMQLWCTNVLTTLFQTILLISLDYVPKATIDKLDRVVPWTHPYVVCQQGSDLLLLEEPNYGTL